MTSTPPAARVPDPPVRAALVGLGSVSDLDRLGDVDIPAVDVVAPVDLVEERRLRHPRTGVGPPRWSTDLVVDGLRLGLAASASHDGGGIGIDPATSSDGRRSTSARYPQGREHTGSTPVMTNGPFAAATAVEEAGADGYRGSIVPGWDIGGNANGGYLLAMGARALVAATGRPDPVTVTAHFLSPGKPGPVDISTVVVKEGRRFATGSATVRAAGRPLLAVLGTFGDLSDDPGALLVDGSPPDLPPVDDCVHFAPTATFPPPFNGHVDLHLHPDDIGFTRGARSGVARVRGWFRLPHGEPTDTVALLCALDAFPPTIFNADLPVGWTPTVELTAHVRSRPAPGGLRCRFTTRFVTSGFLEEDGEVWDADDRLVAQSRQLALVPRG